MNTTELNLLFFDSPDEKAIYAQDVSRYNPDIQTSCNRLEIIPPNYSTKFQFEYPLNQFISIDSNVFNWTNTNKYEFLLQLSDGAWMFTQSVAPNDKLTRTYIHFKTTCLKNKILKFIQINTDCPTIDFDDKQAKELLNLLNWLTLAKEFAEIYQEINKANLIYNQVERQFNILQKNV